MDTGLFGFPVCLLRSDITDGGVNPPPIVIAFVREQVAPRGIAIRVLALMDQLGFQCVFRAKSAIASGMKSATPRRVQALDRWAVHGALLVRNDGRGTDASRENVDATIREVLRLKHEGGASDRQIARSLSLARSTVALTLERAAAAGLRWPLPATLSDRVLEGMLYAGHGRRQGERRKAEPDWAGPSPELTTLSFSAWNDNSALNRRLRCMS